MVAAAAICAWAIAAMVNVLAVQMVMRYRDNHIVARNTLLMALLVAGMIAGI